MTILTSQQIVHIVVDEFGADLLMWYRSIFKGKKFDNLDSLPVIKAQAFISLGDACRPAFWLKSFNLRNCSLPFDWMMGYSLSAVIDTITNGVDDWFKQYVEESTDTVKSNRRVKDTNSKMISLHAFPMTCTVDEYKPEFYAKFKRRYSRLKSILENSNILCFLSNRSDSIKDFTEFAEKLHKIFPHTRFIFINIRHSLDKNDITRYYLNSKSVMYDISANDTNTEEKENTSSEPWWGNVHLWKNVCKNLHIISASDKINTTKTVHLKIFNFLPVATITYQGGRTTLKVFGCSVWKKREIADTKTVKYYLFGLPVLSDTWE